MRRYTVEQYAQGEYINTCIIGALCARDALLRALDVDDKLRAEITARPNDCAVAVKVDGTDTQWHATRG